MNKEVVETLKLNSYSWVVHSLVGILETLGIGAAIYVHQEDIESFIVRQCPNGELRHWYGSRRK